MSSLFLSATLLACDNSNALGFTSDNGKKGKAAKVVEPASNAVAVAQKWEVPPILREVSGIAYLGDGKFACVQDEAGVIFIYNTATKTLDKQVTFAAAGDYEGIALVNETAYVVRSDGRLFEVANWQSASPKITEHSTPLNAAHNVEGLTYDARQNRLLLAIKGIESGSPTYKGVYAFDLATKKLASQPLLKLNLNDPLLVKTVAKKKKKKAGSDWQPSEIALHPTTGDIYLLEATNPQLFILNPDGSIKARHKLNDAEFYKPEGIAFGPKGELYISNEGKNDPGNILLVNFQGTK